MPSQTQIAVLGGGCFWCLEAVFVSLRGVISVVPGYAGGTRQNPSYEDVCTGKTGHAEVIRIEFDPTVITFEDLLTVFFAAHDPTTPNRQGNDIGTQYRSIILYTNDQQKTIAEQFVERLNQKGPKTVTQIVPLETFFEAEAYHHNYFANNPDKAYCQFVINPKLEHVRERFNALMKK